MGQETAAEPPQLQTPRLEVQLDLHPLRADLQLQQTIWPDNASDMSLSHKRKLSSNDSDATSDTSGRFDDADESEPELNRDVDEAPVARSVQSVHSAKRRRSNDWPLREEVVYDEHGMRIDPSHRKSPKKSIRSPRAASKDQNHGSPILRMRRSRFIEGSMSDRTSEKPPSIFLRDGTLMDDTSDRKDKQDRQNANVVGHKGSGIFRFGKAIATAFNPFGTWGNKAEVWKGVQDGPKAHKEIMKQRQARAEKAYAELKNSGYKGTKVDGGVDPHIADETWKAIQEKMDYKLPGEYSQTRTYISEDESQVVPLQTKNATPTPARETGFPKLKSFHDLRKRTSALSISPVRTRDVSPIQPSIESDSQDSHLAVQNRQSRKDLFRHAKLLKKVSNLEDKLEKARRELRELAQEDAPPVPTICLDDVHGRRFVPGVLPSLPSERLLQHQLTSTSEAESGPEPFRALSPSYLTDTETERSDRKLQSVSPKLRKLSKSRVPSNSLSRKRKTSAVDTSKVPANPQEDSHTTSTDCGKIVETPKKQSRQTKSQKVAKNDSPRAQKVKAEDGQDKTAEKLETKQTRSKRTSSLTTNSDQRLKAKQSSRNLRIVNPEDDADSETTEYPPLKSSRPFYLQEQHQLEPNIAKVPAAPSPTKSWGQGNEENVPPVPPVPKELLENVIRLSSTSTATKAGRTRNLAKINESDNMVSAKSPSKSERVPSKEFTWPEDIF